MLTQLIISDVAVIAHAEISLRGGFSVFTGETGAGKSLIIDSLNMVLGERGNRELIRFGEKRARVEALFCVDENVKKRAESIIGEIDGNEIVLSREIHEDGRNVCKINGALATVSGLRALAPLLVNIHGQHDGQRLLSQGSHIDFVDALAKNASLIAKYKEIFEKQKSAQAEFDELVHGREEKLKRLDILKYWVEEIDAASLSEGEEEELEKKRNLMRSGEKLRENISAAYNGLYEGEENVYSYLSRVVALVHNAQGIDESLLETAEMLDDALYKIEDAARELGSYAEGLDFDPAQLEQVQERLDLIYKLKVKYGSDIEKILKYADDCRAEIESIEFADIHENELRIQIEQLSQELSEAAQKLSDSRKKAAKGLCKGVLQALSELEMKNVRFEVKTEETDYTATGRDKIEFEVATNASQPLRPLQNIASGGEMSRICLAIKTVLSDADEVPTLIFDEIDVGVSGRAAQKIGDKMRKLGENKQVVSITHLPQIAAQGENHYLIEKDIHGGDAKTTVTLLEHDGRINEIARIISGDEITKGAIAAAEEMLG